MKNIALVLITTILLTIFSGCQSIISQPVDLADEQGKLPNNNTEGDEDMVDREDSLPGDNAAVDTDLPADVKDPVGFAYNVIKYEILDTVPDEFAALIEEKKMSAAAEVIKEEADYKIALISLGERSTGGYSIEIVEVADIENGKATVRYREATPAPDAMVTQAITYPYIVLRIETSLPVVFAE